MTLMATINHFSRRVLGPAGADRPTKDWTPTHQHKKGGLYRRLTEAVYEPDRSDVVIYDDADGTVWVRPKPEFEDGRFTPLG